MYEWSEYKRLLNLRKHGLDFQDAALVLAGHTVTHGDTSAPVGEQRFISLGLLDGMVVSIVHAGAGERIRIISFRKATRHESNAYFAQVPF